MNNLMIDLESMGKKPNAPIVSIGAVFFDPQSGELGQEFYTAVNLESAMEQGAVPDGDTILWWLRQSSEARSAICVDDAMPISSALSELSHFINRHSDNPKYLKVWGNGATFATLYCAAHMSVPARFARGNFGMITTSEPSSH